MGKAISVKYCILWIFLHLSVLQGYAQYFDTGQDPGILHWRQFKTSNFKVIYPTDYEKEAKRYMQLLQDAIPRVSSSLGSVPSKRLPIIVHNHSAVSNGMVSWSPRRMEIYPLPPQSNYPQDWLEQLATHELRHAVQLNKLNTNTAHWLTFLFGEQITSALVGLYVPSWFMEGDAVVIETALSKSGRGRVPNFEMELRAQFLDHQIYSYDKAVFGSYLTMIPNRYTLGYYLVGTSREFYGNKIWKTALEAVAHDPFLPNPFCRGIKKACGLTEGELYRKCMMHLDSIWKQQDKKIKKSPVNKILLKENSQYADYHFPAYMDHGGYFAIRNSIDDISRFVKIDSIGNIITLYTPGEVNTDALGYLNGKIYWAENMPDLRWENRSWSVIKIYDINTKELVTLGKGKRWFAPAPSPDQQRIAVVEVKPDNQISLLIIEAKNGQVIQEFSNPENYLYMTPAWDARGEKIICIVQGKAGKAIAEVETTTGRMKLLSQFTSIEISGPVYGNNQVLFLGGFNGIDNIYSLDIKSLIIKQISSSQFGAHDAGLSEDGRTLIYVDYSAQGHKPVEMRLNDGVSIPLSDIRNSSWRLDSILSMQEGGPVIFEPTDSSIVSVPYPKVLHLLNFHSWAPVYLDAGNIGVTPGISLMSQNVLSTSFLTLGYQYNRVEQTGKYTADFTYKGFYPVININYSNGERGLSYDPTHSGEKIRFTFGEEETQLKISVPLNFTHSKYYTKVTPSVGMTDFKRYKTASSPPGLIMLPIQSIDAGIIGFHILKYSVKDILPRWGQILSLQHRSHFPGIKDSASINAVSSSLFFPGFWRHHSVKVGLEFQQKKSSKYYSFSDYIRFPRGYEYTTGKEFSSLALDYVFPLCYPEWSLPRVIYLKRIAGNLFGEIARNSTAAAYDYQAVGAEVTAECHLFRFYAPLNLGIRGIYNTNKALLNFEFLYSINLSSF